MQYISKLKSFKLLVGVLALAGSLLAGSLAPGHAFAGHTICRTDPIVTLSNGVVVSMYADVQDTLSGIQHVAYVLHAPVGTSVTAITYDQYGYLESLQFQADQSPRSYATTTTVTTVTPNISVTAGASVSGIACKKQPQSKSGVSGMAITLSFTC
jgi:hypothetical protein